MYFKIRRILTKEIQANVLAHYKHKVIHGEEKVDETESSIQCQTVSSSSHEIAGDYWLQS